MRYLIIFLSFLCFNNVSAGVSDTVKLKQNKHELGLNATFFIKQFVDFSNNNNIAISPYAISYKLITPKQNALRTSIGLDYRGTKDPEENGDDKTTSKSINLNYRIGFEHRFDLGKKWMAFAGFDVVSDLNKMTTNTITTVISPNPPFQEIESKFIRNDQTIGVGLGPVVGIQINFTPKISIYTESAFLFNQSFTKSEARSTPAVITENMDKSSSNSMQFVLPSSLFFAFKF